MSQDIQLLNEYTYSRKHIDRYIREDIEAKHTNKLKKGEGLVSKMIDGDYYPSKAARFAQLKQLDISKLVVDVLVGVAYCFKEELFASVVGRLCGKLGLSNKEEAITTVADVLAELVKTDLFDIKVATGNLTIISKLELDPKLLNYIKNSTYLPPMVCEPLEVTSNYHSGYLTHNESLILQNNHHDDPISLDVINTQNKVKLKMDREFLSTVEERPSKKFDSADSELNWKEFRRQSYEIYILLAKQSEHLYLTNRFDKRGRMYASGYHINTQGAPFKKAMLEFVEEESIEITYSGE